MTGRSRLASIPLLLLSTLLAMVSASGQADAGANDFSPNTEFKLCNAMGGSCSETLAAQRTRDERKQRQIVEALIRTALRWRRGGDVEA